MWRGVPKPSSAGPPGPGVGDINSVVDETDSDLFSNGTFIGPGGTCGLGCCISTVWTCAVSAGGGEVVGVRMDAGVSRSGSGGGMFTPFDTWPLIGISSSRSEESISPLSIGPFWGVLEHGAAAGVVGVGTSLPATSAYPTGSGVELEDLMLTDLRKTWWGEVDT